ncbi:hypothetical protein COLO4_25253 [Corchorus olitorius]|uniref:Uncharacterized protein n=1 Tax=Corchorus olitorius TaxID=93759 RepID=A0A1R3I3T0_9ROSI|nr:hypothetical protein COLO4_25253 [Corchorus olitorius]
MEKNENDAVAIAILRLRSILLTSYATLSPLKWIIVFLALYHSCPYKLGDWQNMLLHTLWLIAALSVLAVTILICVWALKETAEVMALIFRFAMALTNAQVASRKKQHQ